jgi:hypothetical protein
VQHKQQQQSTGVAIASCWQPPSLSQQGSCWLAATHAVTISDIRHNDSRGSNYAGELLHTVISCTHLVQSISKRRAVQACAVHATVPATSVLQQPAAA